MSVVTVQQMADRVAALLAERLRVKGDTLEARLARAGRRACRAACARPGRRWFRPP